MWTAKLGVWASLLCRATMALHSYANRRLAVRLWAPDEDCGGGVAPYATLSYNMPGVTLAETGHFYFFVRVKYIAMADAIAAAGYIERVA